MKERKHGKKEQQQTRKQDGKPEKMKRRDQMCNVSDDTKGYGLPPSALPVILLRARWGRRLNA
jgi:hypothetical protein